MVDSGVAILNESCGVESISINNPYAWVFQVAADETTVAQEIISTKQSIDETSIAREVPTTKQYIDVTTVGQGVLSTKQYIHETSVAREVPSTKQYIDETSVAGEVPSTKQYIDVTTEQVSSTSTSQTTSSPRATCPRWFHFDRISNESTSVDEPNFTFCFSVEAALADVTIAANTWVPCMTWKLSGTADPLLELYTEPNGVFLAQNDDGNSLAVQNCYAAVLSYRLQRGDYRVVIRNPKCAYGKFELRLSAEIDRNLK